VSDIRGSTVKEKEEKNDEKSSSEGVVEGKGVSKGNRRSWKTIIAVISCLPLAGLSFLWEGI
jgi:hypothetical protein